MSQTKQDDLFEDMKDFINGISIILKHEEYGSNTIAHMVEQADLILKQINKMEE